MPVTHQKMEEYIAPRRGFASADITPGPVDATVFHSVAGFDKVGAIASCADTANTETMTLTLLQATNAAGAGKKVLGTARVVTNATGGAAPLANLVSEAVENMDHANGFTFVGARIAGSEVAVLPGEVVMMLAGARYKPVA